MRQRWPETLLRDLLENIETFNPAGSPSREFEYIDVSSVSNQTFQIGETQRVQGKNAPSRARRIVRTNDVIFATIRPTLRRIAVIPERLNNQVCSTGYMVLRPKPHIAHRFLFHWLFTEAFMEQMAALQKGASYPAVTDYEVKSRRVPVPPISEQRRIVTMLDEAFASIAIAIANAEKNLQNARELFETQVNVLLHRRGDKWRDLALGEACIVERGSSPRPIKEYFTTAVNGVNWIKIGDTEAGGKYVDSTAQKITPEGAKQSRFVKEGDFILTNSMSFGRPYIMRTSGYIHDGWFVLRPSISVDTEFFYYLLSSRLVQAQFRALASGSVVKNISGDLVKKAVLPIPPLAEQHAIVKSTLGLEEKTQRLCVIYQSKIAALDELKQSLLHEAFSGKL